MGNWNSKENKGEIAKFRRGCAYMVENSNDIVISGNVRNSKYVPCGGILWDGSSLCTKHKCRTYNCMNAIVSDDKLYCDAHLSAAAPQKAGETPNE